MGKCIYIDAAIQQVYEVEITEGENHLKKLRALVGGHIEVAWQSPAYDTLYVDEEGTMKAQRHFFRFKPRGDYVLCGSGVIVGPERYDREGEYAGTGDVTLTVERIRAMVTFLDREQFDAWAKANASEPAVVFYTLGPDGECVAEEVIIRMGKLFGDMPKLPPEDDQSKT